MPIYVSGGSSQTFAPAPEGAHQAVCVDVVDLGMLPTPWGDKHKVTIKWQISEDMSDGRPFLVSKRYTASLHEKANLRHDLEAWRGKAFTETEAQQFDLETLLGINCLVNIIHKTDAKDTGKVWANVASITPLVKGMAKITGRDYIRESERQSADQTPEYDDEVGF